MELAYLWQGKLYAKHGDQPPRPIESAFGRDMVAAALEIQRKHEWKASGIGGRMMAGSTGADGGNGDPQAIPVHITAVTAGPEPGQLLYAVETDRVGGLFVYDRATGKEQRLFHRENFHIRDLARHPDLPQCACAIPAPDQTSNIAIIPDERPFVNEVTSGESMDEAPAWVPGQPQQLVFQSAGVGRDAAGHFRGAAPFAIHRLDLETGNMEVLLEDAQYDLLLPRMNRAGDLFYIKRPYQFGTRLSLKAVLLDVVLFPWRLLTSIVHFCNFFSLTFSGKPLITASGPRREGPDLRTVVLRGKLLDARQALRSSGEQPDAPALVPRSWQLVRRSSDGTETVLAHAVVAYDLVADRPVYTNGRCFYRIDDDLSKHLILKGQWADSLLAFAS